MLLLSAWGASSGQLKKGDPMTVEIAGKEQFWATVTAEGGTDGDSKYVVTDGAGVSHPVQRADLRARVWYTTAQIGVSNDKRHDSYATQAFMTQMIDQWRLFKGGFLSLYVHSDNAGPCQACHNRTNLHCLRVRCRFSL